MLTQCLMILCVIHTFQADLTSQLEDETLTTSSLSQDLNETNSSHEDEGESTQEPSETTTEYLTETSTLATNENIESQVGGVTEVAITETSEGPHSTTTALSSTEAAPSTTAANVLKTQNHTDHACMCDLLVEECDINCCCDPDCSEGQRRVFTRCEDHSIRYDTNHCYKTNFIYRNKTDYALRQTDNGLFCIVRDNLPFKYRHVSAPVVTSLEAFQKNLRRQAVYSYGRAPTEAALFSPEPYREGARIWVFEDKVLSGFDVPQSLFTLQCSSRHPVLYLADFSSECSYTVPRNKTECENAAHFDMKRVVERMRILASPVGVNASEPLTMDKVCRNTTCLRITPHVCRDDVCVSNATTSPKYAGGVCHNLTRHAEYEVVHNGTGGIAAVKALFWTQDAATAQDRQMLHRVTVRFRWVGSSPTARRRSGRPGYQTGRPVMAGRKVSLATNDTVREAIEQGSEPGQGLSVFGSDQGACATSRVAIGFRENGHYTCRLVVTRGNFSREACTALQRHVFRVLTGDDLVNATATNTFNRWVATLGDSSVEHPGDWVPVLFDLYPAVSSQSFLSDPHQLTCKNVITDLSIQIAFAYIGSFSNPQAKILGVAFQLGKGKDLSLRKATPSRQLTLSTFVNFVDTTEPAMKEFARPPGFEAKLPYDFFYPFFSSAAKRTSFAYLVITFIVLFL